MYRDEAIEEIRAVRHRISEKYGHDIRALVKHYQELEATKYADRVFMRRGVIVTGTKHSVDQPVIND